MFWWCLHNVYAALHVPPKAEELRVVTGPPPPQLIKRPPAPREWVML